MISSTTKIKCLQDIIALQKTSTERLSLEISSPVVRAITLAFLEKRIRGEWYYVPQSSEVQDFNFAFLGFSGRPQLAPQHLWLWPRDGKKVPALIIRKTVVLQEVVPNCYGQYREKLSTLSAVVTLENNILKFDGFLQEEDLLRSGDNNEKY